MEEEKQNFPSSTGTVNKLRMMGWNTVPKKASRLISSVYFQGLTLTKIEGGTVSKNSGSNSRLVFSEIKGEESSL